MSEQQSNGREGDPIARDIDEREADSGDIVAGEQVLDEGRVSPSQDDFTEGDGAHSGAHGVDDDEATSDDLEHAADERQDAGAPPPQPEAPG
ncbi:MAG: hypothetical protein KIT89_02050 [Microcella sp.]|uniref:hypothetical protein n=1 Tax=Microcella sp. TaxID=1913979 RepID=UPI0024CD9EBC|nr:hypothetical protein [Microcella sp.]UYN84035.1 MAG: hypothetical protein KIT89_02050 [Microcella sp.]